MTKKQKAAHGAKTEAASKTPKADLTEKLQYAFCRLIYPSGFFNRDASLEIDRLTVENEALRAQIRLLAGLS